jgi:uncharacterized protein (DUF2235 family)
VSKNILIFADGTGQAGGIRPDQCLSNIYKLYRATRVGPDNTMRPTEQVAFYHPGLGTLTETGGLRLGSVDKVMSILGLLTGMGITNNIVDCYEAILEKYEPGDRIYLFGFSRGAYTVRSVAGVLKLCGIPTRDKDAQRLPVSGPRLRAIAEEAVSRVYEYRAGKDGWKHTPEREKRASEFRAKYNSNATAPEDVTTGLSNVAPYFVGVFDTVAALGARGMRRVGLIAALTLVTGIVSLVLARVIEVLVLQPLLPIPFWPTFGIIAAIISISLGRRLFRSRWKSRDYDMSLDARIKFARHAQAIDETRVDFARVGWGHSNDVRAHAGDDKTWFKQIWFAGNHSDIGGSYPEDESRLSDIALSWMLGEMLELDHPILIERKELNLFPSADGMQHCEVQLSKETRPWLPWEANAREIKPDAVLHPTVLQRLALPSVKNFREWQPYRPEALRNHKDVAHFYLNKLQS